MLENYPDLFEVLVNRSYHGQVCRVPKNDFVVLITSSSPLAPYARSRRGRPRGQGNYHGNGGKAASKPTISRCLHVGNVGIKASEEDLKEEFGQFGEIEDIKIVHQGGKGDNSQ